jgi:hypothetical protein
VGPRVGFDAEVMAICCLLSTTPHLRSNGRIKVRSGKCDRLCGLVVRVLGYRSGGPGSIPGTTKKK